MIRKGSAFAVATALVIACSSILTTPAQAASQATATSVALTAGDDCSRADLDLGIRSGDVDREYGLSTNAAGATLDQSENDGSALDNLDGVFNGYGIGISPDQLDSTIIGTYAYVGTTPPLSTTTAEWFVLYRCGADGDNQVLYSCFGDYGTCPRTATQGLTALLGVTVSTVAPAPGETVVVTATGCTSDIGSVAAVSLLRDGSLVTGVFPITPNPDGSFQVPVTVPADLAPDTALVVRTVCGDGDVVVASADIGLTVTVVEPVSEPTEPTTEPEPAASTSPRFTG
jgi:hypothetical protein